MTDDDIIRQMNEYYFKRAGLHDYCMSYTSNEDMEKLLGAIIRLFEKDIIGRDVLEIACGTGNWTQILARRARSVLATDINEPMLEIARRKSYANPYVRFEAVDAYSLGKIKGTFNAAFAADWWSHIPGTMITPFLKGLHSRLRKGARVIFLDMTPRASLNIESHFYNENGDFVRRRSLPDGGEYLVVKNFPTENELKGILKGMAEDIRFHEHLNLQRWMVSYRVK